MIFTPEEIQRLFDIIDYRLARIVADVLGGDALKPEDKELLKRNGYDWAKELKKFHLIINHFFLVGYPAF